MFMHIYNSQILLNEIQMIDLSMLLYETYLLAGLTTDGWDIKTGSATSFSDWITTNPTSHNSRLASLPQESGSSSFVFSNSNRSITMEKLPEAGTNAALHATFRLILKDATSLKVMSPKEAIGKSVILEPIDLPGMVVVQQGTNGNLGITNSESSRVLLHSVWLQDWMERTGRFPWNQKARRVAMLTVVLTII